MAPLKRKLISKAAIWIVAATTLFATGCSTAQKTTPELSRLQGRKVALVEVDGEYTAKKIVETALVNQLVKRGTFELLSKQEVQAARSEPGIDPTDPAAIARKAGADYALTAKVLRFSAEQSEGYSDEETEDSQLAKERGDGKTRRLFKVRSMTGSVAVELSFTGASQEAIPGTRTAVAEHQDTVKEEARTSAAHLPPKLRFLEDIANEAFRLFFEQYN